MPAIERSVLWRRGLALYRCAYAALTLWAAATALHGQGPALGRGLHRLETAGPAWWRADVLQWVGWAAAHRQWLALALGASCIVRLIEAWGLWHSRRWADWLVAASAAAFLPFEVAAAWHQPSAPRLLLVAFSLLFVAWLVRDARRLAHPPSR